MDESTEGVTLYAGFVFDLLSTLESKRDTFAAPLFDMAEDLDPDNPTEKIPIRLYNEMCCWVEEHLGVASVRSAGATIGLRVFDFMRQADLVPEDPTPLQIVEGIRDVARTAVQDPRDRGFEVLEAEERRILLRRTQTFHCLLQEGLIRSLVQRTGVRLPRATHKACVRDGAPYCEYEITWLE